MNIYYLCLPGVAPKHVLNGGVNRVVRVCGGDWYAARAQALQHALEDGARTCMVVGGHCSITRVFRQDPTGRTADRGAWPSGVSAHEDNHLLNYLERILREVAAGVLVPPQAAIRNIPWEGSYHLPVPPMVAAYNLSAIQSVRFTDASLGHWLCQSGFRLWTLGDFAYTGAPTLDEYGTAARWRNAYENALKEFL